MGLKVSGCRQPELCSQSGRTMNDSRSKAVGCTAGPVVVEEVPARVSPRLALQSQGDEPVRERVVRPAIVEETYTLVQQDLATLRAAGPNEFRATVAKALQARSAPMLLLRVRELRDFGRLPTYAEVERSLENFRDITDDDLVVFVSHRWWRPTSPDGDRHEKVRHLLDILPELHEMHGLPGKIYIWWDAFSIRAAEPSVHSVDRSAQIRAMPLYMAASDICIAIKADDEESYTTLADTDCYQSGSYANRIWTMGELFLFTSDFAMDASIKRTRKRTLVELEIGYDYQNRRLADSYHMSTDGIASMRGLFHDNLQTWLPPSTNVTHLGDLDLLEPTLVAVRSRAEERLHAACQMGFVNAAFSFLWQGDSPNAFDKLGYTPVMTCLRNIECAAEVMKVLLDNGANVHIQHPVYLRTALHQAVMSGACDCVSMLLGASANANALDAKGRTALHLAAGVALGPLSHVIAERLLASGAKAGVVDCTGMAAADHARDHGNHAVLALLDDYQVNV